MTLFFEHDPAAPSPLDGWPLPTIAPYVEPGAQLSLVRDLRRYVEGRITGRSYLVAGHRGAGKTALVARAVDLVRTDLLRASVRAEGSSLSAQPFQRPLLVKLHGPSMLRSPDPPAPPADATPATTSPAVVDGKQPPPAPPGPTPAPSPAPTPPSDSAAPPAPPKPGVHAALVQIGIGLYRALAAETATGFRAHARLVTDPQLREARELAAQLALDLDDGVTPARLREFWLRAGRLRHGVLWPRSADDTLDACQMDDQGMREILAVATAGQAFQVCSGRVSYETTSKNSDAQTETHELKDASDLREVIDRLGTLGIATAAGVAIFASQGALAGVGTGVLTWLFGALTVSWSKSRTRKQDLAVDYSFIRDSDVATLDRDLPVVINRLRDAGLAPVFVVDELDKVPNAADAIVDLVKQLKHLIADFGFFCFLVDRSCYAEFQQRIAVGGYPLEHTLFGERILLTPEADPLYRFLLTRTVARPPEGALPARAVFALATMHEAQMNLTAVIRVMSRAVRQAPDALGEVADQLQQRRQVLATLQIAINETLRSAPLADRALASPAFAQLAIDTLYYPSTIWATGELVIDPTRERLSAYLAKRMAERAAGDKASEITPSAPELNRLHTALIRMLDGLADLTVVRAAASQRRLSGEAGAPADDEASLAEVVPPEVTAILAATDGSYRFLFDRDGDPVASEAGRLSDEQIVRIRTLLGYADTLDDLLTTVGTTIDELAATPLLSGLSTEAVTMARSQLLIAVALGTSSEETVQQMATLERLQAEVKRSRGPLASLLRIVAVVGRLAHRQGGVLPAIQRLLPLSKPAGQWLSIAPDGVAPLPLDAAGLTRWRDALLALPAPAIGKGEVGDEDYQKLAPVLEQLAIGKRLAVRFSLDDLVHAAAERLPYRALALDARAMTAQDWSLLALSALPTVSVKQARAPYWLLAAALRGLGFGAPGLLELVDGDAIGELSAAGFLLVTPLLSAEACLTLAAKFTSNAPERPSGTVVIDTDDEAYGRALPSQTRPTLLVHADLVDEYAQALNWLAANGILTVGADARRRETVDEG